MPVLQVQAAMQTDFMSKDIQDQEFHWQQMLIPAVRQMRAELTPFEVSSMGQIAVTLLSQQYKEGWSGCTYRGRPLWTFTQSLPHYLQRLIGLADSDTTRWQYTWSSWKVTGCLDLARNHAG